MPTTLPMTARGRLPAAGQARDLAFDRCEQVVDVVALQETLTQGIERGALLGRRRALLAVPARAPRLRLLLVLVGPGVNRRARLLQPCAQLVRIRARLAQLPNLVQLLVQREDLLEQRRRHLASPWPRACRGVLRLRRGQSFNSEQMLHARHGDLQRAIRAVPERRALAAGQSFG